MHFLRTCFRECSRTERSAASAPPLNLLNKLQHVTGDLTMEKHDFCLDHGVILLAGRFGVLCLMGISIWVFFTTSRGGLF